MQKPSSKLIPGLVGGTAIAVFSTVPMVNCCCCLWMVLGGGLAAWMASRGSPVKKGPSSRDSAVAGLLAGIFGALFAGVLHALLMATMGQRSAWSLFDSFYGVLKDMPRELTDSLERIEAANPLEPVFVLANLAISLVLYSTFATAGGILFNALFGRKRK